MRTLPATSWIVTAVTATALLWCHGAYPQAHAGPLGAPAGGVAAVEASALPGDPAAPPGCAFAAKSTGKADRSPVPWPVALAATMTPGPSQAPAVSRMASPGLWAPSVAPHHASLFRQAVLLRI